MRSRVRLWCLVGVLGLLSSWGSFSHAAVTVDVDAVTLNDLLSAAALQEVSVPITDQRKLTVQMENLEVTGLDPTAGNIVTSMRVRVPEIGLALTVEPRVSLTAVRQDEESLLELRFEKIDLPLPLAGTVNIAGLLPPLRYPANHLWLVAGGSGDLIVRSRLNKISMGRTAISLEFEIDVRPREEGAP